MTSELKPCASDVVQITKHDRPITMKDIEEFDGGCMNTRAVPDVPDTLVDKLPYEALIADKTAENPTVIDSDGLSDVPELKRYSRIDTFILPNPEGGYVLHSQAAEIFAAKDAEIERLKSDLGECSYKLRCQIDKTKAAEAKLAQYEAQVPVAYQFGIADPEGVIRFIGVMSKTPKTLSRPLYASPAPAADLKAENEEIRGQALRVIIAFDPDNDLDNPEKFNAYHDLKAALNVEAQT